MGREASPSRNFSRLRPDLWDYKVDVRSAQRKKETGVAESQSVRSDGSEQMIIRRHVEIQVHDDDNQAQNSNTSL